MNNEKIKYVLRDLESNLPVYIQNVLTDSAEDPHYSAVYISNLIKCYIELRTELGEELPYHDVKSFILFEGFDEKEYELFENSRLKESAYYRGVQY